MKIAFTKVGISPKPIEIVSQGIQLKGILKKSGYHRVLLDAHVEGKLPLVCDRCGQSFIYLMDTPLRLRLQDCVAEDKDDLDIIEFLDGIIDIHYILESEINAIEGAFHYCTACESNETPLEIEF